MLAAALTAVAALALAFASSEPGRGMPTVHERYFGTTSELAALSGRDLTSAEGSVCPRLPGVGPRHGVSAQQYNQECLFRVARLNGMAWATITAFWSVIQPDLRAPPDWEQLDGRIAAALCQDVEPVIRTVNAPSQPAGRPGTRVSGEPGAPPRAAGGAMPQYRAWIRALAQRYGPGGELEAELARGGGGCNGGQPPPIRSAGAIVIWNEQNKPGGWGGIDPLRGRVPGCGATSCDSALHYLRMLRAARRGVADSRRDLDIVVGGLTARTAADPSLASYVDALYSRRIPFNPQFDALAVHPYGPARVAGARSPELAAAGIVATVRARLDANGGAAKRIWVLELGWPSCGQPGAIHPQACVERTFRSRNTDEAGQADLLAGAIDAMTRWRDRWRLERLGLWGLADLGTAADPGRGTTAWLGRDTPAACEWCHGAGLWRSDWSAKPAYYAWWRQLLRWTGGIDGRLAALARGLTP